jgi:uncharacterized protein (TIGR01777 family)
LIGQALIEAFTDKGWIFHSIPRNAYAQPDEEFLQKNIEGAEVVINLAGAPILKRWTDKYKKEILESRITPTRKIVTAINQAQVKPRLFISTSAIGIYDSTNSHDEGSTAFADDFLGRLCIDWESEAFHAKSCTRVVVLRTGIVLSRKGGAMKAMHRYFSIGLGGVIGKGDQSFSFIHIRDLMSLYKFILENENISGIVNAVSPNPISNSHFTKILGRVLVQPTVFRIPVRILKAKYGEAAETLIKGQNVIPKKLANNGFVFEYPTIEKTLLNLYRI